MRLKNIFRSFCGGLALLLALACDGEATDTEVVVSFGAWPPYHDTELPGFGLLPEIIKAAFARSGFAVTFAGRIPWARTLSSLESGAYYDATASAFHTAERARKFLFSDAILESRLVLFRRKEDNVRWRTLADLASYRIIVERGAAYSPEFDTASYLDKFEVTYNHQILEMIVRGRGDLGAVDLLAAQHYINAHGERLGGRLAALSPPLASRTIHMMFSRKRPGVAQKIEAFNRGLNAIRRDGTLEAIMQKNGFSLD